jgi:histidinol-phosphate phosphatase family protein
MTPAIFLDKDGTLLVDVPYNVDPALMRFAPTVAQGLARLGSLNRPLIVISNQPGVAFGMFTIGDLSRVRAQLAAMFRSAGAHLHDFYYCPHHPEGVVAPYAVACRCRKPLPGLLHAAASDHAIDLSASWFIGDILDDVEAAWRAGCRSVLVNNGNETEWHSAAGRVPDRIVSDFSGASREVLGQYRQPA